MIRSYYSMSAQVEGTTKPQIYINILKSVPIKIASDIEVKKIESIVKEIMNLEKNNEKDTDYKSIIHLEERIDSEIYRIYGFRAE
ncbi:MAG: hypothetical protein BWY21_01527 [Parcubacteria group bacterium ADurb.Bin216]|nr:MAG: hypothetical protein BWY21_01527 [Parcubacteria group bacterium ADurb.Bin216]